jgi:hypothetical protein
MLKKILLAILGLLLVIFIIGLFQSDEMKVSRSAVIAAKPDIVYGIVNDFHQWDHWSPWSKLDPAMKVILPRIKICEKDEWRFSRNRVILVVSE